MFNFGDIQWQKSYEVGNEEIDFEHQLFVKIIQKIINSQHTNCHIDYIERLVLELYKYAEFHFCSEENIMISIDYPGFKEHQELHTQLLIELREKINTTNIQFIDFPDLIRFVITWFKSHTIEEDKKIANYIKRHHL